MSNKAYKFRIYPNKEQQILFAKTFGCVRFVYNKMLSDRIEHYKRTKQTLSVSPAQYKKEFEWLKEVDSLALANAWTNLQSAYRNFFKRKDAGFPKFKAKKGKNTYTTSIVGNNIYLENGYLRLPKVGLVRVKQHRQIPAGYKLKSVTVSKTASGKYYASILYEYENVVESVKVDENKILGLDYKTSCLYVDSCGNTAKMPKYYKESYKKLAKEQRKLSRKQIGSSNRNKQRIKVARVHEKISNQRKDFLHKRSTQIANEYDLICIEDISIKDIVSERKYRNFRKSTLDNGWYSFTEMLAYKLKERGKYLIKLDKNFPSSQMCSSCGKINSVLVNDSIRKWDCPHCGAHHDRDINAAINIKVEGYRQYLIAV